jgi:hypothetical protein
MSMMGELTFFLGIQVKQTKQGTFVHQGKYTKDLMKKFNMTELSTMTNIDRAFYTIPWEDLHAGPSLHSLSASASDHCPLLLCCSERPVEPPVFKFKSHWPVMPGFHECVQQAWQKPITSPHNAAMMLHIKLSRTAKALTFWARKLIPQGKLAAIICYEVIIRLETAQEDRILSNEELNLIKLLKRRVRTGRHREIKSTTKIKTNLAQRR